jgi:hypothetical protein
MTWGYPYFPSYLSWCCRHLWTLFLGPFGSDFWPSTRHGPRCSDDLEEILRQESMPVVEHFQKKGRVRRSGAAELYSTRQSFWIVWIFQIFNRLRRVSPATMERAILQAANSPCTGSARTWFLCKTWRLWITQYLCKTVLCVKEGLDAKTFVLFKPRF